MLNLPVSKHLHAAGWAAAALLLGLTIPAASAQTQHEISTAERARIQQVLSSIGPRSHGIREVAISPDGKRLAWVEGGRGGGEIRVAPLDRLSESVPVTVAAAPEERCNESQIVWSPDSRSMAFLTDCDQEGGQPNLFLSSLDGAPARKLTELHGDADAPAFSPDGSRIAFLYVEGATRPAGALAAQDLPSGVIGEDRSDLERVAMVPTAANEPGKPLFATPDNLHVFEFDWSPDSKALAYIASEPPGENNWWIAKLYTQPVAASTAVLENVGIKVAPGEEPRPILAPAEVAGPLHGLQIAVPRWSPDGKSIAFIGGLMSDQGVTGGDVWMVPSAGGAPRDLTAGRPTSPSWIEWEGNRKLWVSEVAGGDCQLAAVQLRGDLSQVSAVAGEPVFRFSGSLGDGRMERSLSATADHSVFVFAGSSFDKPVEIYAARPAAGGARQPAQLTHLNDGVEPRWGKTVSLDWTSDGFHVQGWLMLPRDYDATKRYPMIVEVHGGPASVELPHWGAGGALSPEAFSELGYFVLLPNPRGSFGQGEAFTEANRKDFGYGDLRDILAGVDAAQAKYRIDSESHRPDRMELRRLHEHVRGDPDQRFRVAVAGAGISDWLSYYGENSIDQWMIPYFGASVYDDPKVYAKSSAIDFIKQAHTPTLVVVGDRDGECPAPQSFEFWHALRDLNVPTRLVVYPNEGHGFRNPAHSRDVLERAAEWFAEYMPEEQGVGSRE